MKTYFLLFLFLLPSAAAFQYSDGLVIESRISNTVEFVQTSSSPTLSYLYVYHSWIPIDDYRQEVLGIETTPEAELEYGEAVFEITSLRDVEVSVVFTTRTTAERVRVREKVPFPLEGLDPSLLRYTEPRGLIDVTPEIRMKASDIVGGTDDLYEAVFRLSAWVNEHIEYNLSTLSEEATKSSSWVLEERRGVCVELTNLFISKARSLGIPAKFVSGIAYTDSDLFDFNWEGHGWAEVYFPGHGWVPVDPTYNQIGFVDASHVKLDEGVEGGQHSTRYEWMGRGFDVVPGPLSIESSVSEEGVEVVDGVSVSLGFLSDEVRLDSYNVVIASIRNNNDFYVAKEFFLSRTESMELLSSQGKNVLLRPGEEKDVYWPVKLSGLEEGFVYTMPVAVYDFQGLLDEESFEASQNGNYVDEATTSFFFEESTRSDLELSCFQVDRFSYANDTLEVECTVVLPGSEYVEVCFQGSCRDVFVEGEETLLLEAEAGSPGYKVLVVEASDGVGSVKSFVDFTVLDEAVISFSDIQGSSLSFKEQGGVGFRVERSSVSVPVNVSVVVEHDFFEEEFFVDRLDDYQDFRVSFQARDLKPGENVFIISTFYQDELGRINSAEESVTVFVENLSFLERVRLWLNYINVLF